MTSRLNKIFFKKYQSILSGATIIGLMFALTSILGFIKNRLLVSLFGDSKELGLFFGADIIPSAILKIITIGFLSAALIPVFLKAKKYNEENAYRIASYALNLLIIIVGLFSIIVFFSADFLAENVIASQNIPIDSVSALTPADYQLMANLMRWMMIPQILLMISSFFITIQRAHHKFFISALPPLAYNIGLITFLMFTSKPNIYMPIYGMIFGSLLHTLIPIISIRKEFDFKYFFELRLKNELFREILRLSVIRSASEVIPYLLVIFRSNLIYGISAASMTIWTLSNSIFMAPINILGVSLAQASLPILSSTLQNEGIDHFKKILMTTITQVMFFALPFCVLVLVLRIPLVKLAYGTENLSIWAINMTAYTLAFLSIYIPTTTLEGLVIRAFYSLQDTITPVLTSLLSVLINIALSYYFIVLLGLGLWSLGLSTTIASFINLGLMIIILIKRIEITGLKDFIWRINKLGFSALFMAISLYIPYKLLDKFVLDTNLTYQLITLTITVSIIGTAVYLLFSIVLKVEELILIKKIIKRIQIQKPRLSFK